VAGCEIVPGNALDSRSFESSILPAETFVQLTGVPHPAPWKERQFRAIDAVSAKESIAAASSAGVRHFVYVSVARPAPVMKAYQAVRAECEDALQRSGLTATVLRPWYVLGPGHRWPWLLLPVYNALERLPRTEESARRLGLVTLSEMTAALVWAVENTPQHLRVLDVPSIRTIAAASSAERMAHA
jgi:uncharacterized protein YbjT (DUF2867 family)